MSFFVKFDIDCDTCTFQNVFIQTSTNCYNLQNLRELEKSNRRGNSSYFTLFYREPDFWFRCCVPHFSLHELDICRIQLLQKSLIAVLETFFLTFVCLAFEKDYDKVKHFIYTLHQITYTVLLIETSFCSDIQENFHFFFQKGNFAATQWVDWVFQRLQLWLTNSACPPHRRV